MRSSVSAILSDPAPDNTMSFPDYSQSSSDHSTLLVLCQHIGHQLDTETYNKVVDIIGQVTEVKVADKNGSVRCVRVRYADRYPAENNEWGEFQVGFFLETSGLIVKLISFRLIDGFLVWSLWVPAATKWSLQNFVACMKPVEGNTSARCLTPVVSYSVNKRGRV